ncbi:ATPase, T2SS/T4P/T4SS family [Halovivax limisalsi]|uniref:ATPase, T2SS/T4P/T4SS family n=1 Tax=Halovivax limisalsi TaxID=1453760 RepID=UPI001FFC4837|nr:ATPase, T2SS/T4P/T4SS family [Halovivax limisalsi]
MAIDEGDPAEASEFSDGEPSESTVATGESSGPTRESSVRVGEYTWSDFMAEYGYESEVSTLYPEGPDGSNDRLGLDADDGAGVPRGSDWDRVSFDPTTYLGYHPDDLSSLISETFAPNANVLWNEFLEYVDPETTPVVKDVYTWEHYKWEYYYEDDGSRPRTRDGEIDRFDDEAALGFDPETIEGRLNAAGSAAMELDEVVDERTVNVTEDLDEDDFFSTDHGNTTVVNRYDLEKAVPFEKKTHFIESERYWVNKPYSFVIIFHSEKENEKKYYVIEPYRNEIERELQEFLSGKLRTAIKYADEGVKTKRDETGRREVIERETRRLLKRYDLFEATSNETSLGILDSFRDFFAEDDETDEEAAETVSQLEGMSVRPEPIILEEDPDTLSEYQVEKLLYMLKRDFIGYERIDPIKHDINVEDISCDGYNSPVFVYHSEYEQIISNVYHGEDDLDDFVVKLAQRSGKGISKRLPQVDATLPDGSRAQLTLGKEVSDHGTNYTIRQFKDVPFTPIDLINWNTFSLDEMAFLWLCIENHKSLIFAGGTASGKTTSLNAVSLFIPANTKIVSIEDTREVELPQRNWIASMTRPSFADDSTGDIDEFDLLEAALRQRPDYIVMGEIRGEEGRTLFQVMSTGHTTYTTFHADSVDEVLKRFTTDPINVSKTMFTALDLVSIQTQTRVQGRKVRRNKSLTEINHYEAENDEINVQDVYQWQAETDEYLKMGDSNTLDEIMFDRGWNHEKLQDELFKRKVILAYLIRNGLNTYAEVAATVQAFINDPETILTLIANEQLENSLADLREMESVHIDVDPSKEELVPRPDASSETLNLSMDLLERAEESLFDEYRGKVPSGLASALDDVEADDGAIDSGVEEAFDFEETAVPQSSETAFEDVDDSFAVDESSASEAGAAEAPSWLDDDATIDASTASASGTAQRIESDAPAAESPANPELDGETNEPVTPELDGAAGDHASPPELDGDTDDPSRPEKHDGEEEAVPSLEGAEQPAEEGESSSVDALESLFTGMDETLKSLETGASDTEESDSAAGTSRFEPDTSEFDSMFPDSELNSVFDPDAGESGEATEPTWDLGKHSGASPADQAETGVPDADRSDDDGWFPANASDREEWPDDAKVAEDGDSSASDDVSESQPTRDGSKRSEATDEDLTDAGDGQDSIFGSEDEDSVFGTDPSEPDDEATGSFVAGDDRESSIFGSGSADASTQTGDGTESSRDADDEQAVEGVGDDAVDETGEGEPADASPDDAQSTPSDGADDASTADRADGPQEEDR